MPAFGFSVIQLSHTGTFASFCFLLLFLLLLQAGPFFVPQVTFDELQFLALVH